MKVIAVSSQKGGSGKTTLAAHLAVAAESEGAGPVVLIDTDTQGSLSKWWNARNSQTPVLAQVDTGNLSEACNALRAAGAELVIIDTPPAIVWTIVQVFKVSDLIVVPVRPSPHDLAAAGSTIDLAEEYGKRSIFVVNGATQQARITGEAAIALSQHGRVVPTITHNRTAFAASMIDGRTVLEAVDSSQSAEEIKKLWAYLARQLNSGGRRKNKEKTPKTDEGNTPARTHTRTEATEEESVAVASASGLNE